MVWIMHQLLYGLASHDAYTGWSCGVKCDACDLDHGGAWQILLATSWVARARHVIDKHLNPRVLCCKPPHDVRGNEH